MRRPHPVVIAFAVAISAAILPASAVGAAAVHDPSSGSVHNLDETFVDSIPCIGDFEIHTVANATQHDVSNGNGDWSTFTETGTFETGQQAINVVRDDDDNVISDDLASAAVHYQGHFTIWGNFNLNRNQWNSTFTFNGHGSGSDGSTVQWHQQFHISMTGDITRSVFDKSSCR